MLRRILARLQLDGELFLLTFPFIELQGGPNCSGPRMFGNSPRLLTRVTASLQDMGCVYIRPGSRCMRSLST